MAKYEVRFQRQKAIDNFIADFYCHKAKLIIEIDGSCNEKTFGELYKAGAECFVVGTSGLFSLDQSLETAWKKMQTNFNKATTEE